MTRTGRCRAARLGVALAALAVAFPLAMSSEAAAEDGARFDIASDWYVSAFGAALVPDENNILFDQFGWQGSIAAGRRLDDGRFRAELEVTRRRIGLVGLNGAAAAPGQFSAQSVFLNGYVHFAPDAAWGPYLGAGFGRGRQSYRLSGMADQGDFLIVMDDDSESFVYHLMGGLDFAFSQRLAGHIEARYFTLEDKTIGANFGRWNGIERSYQVGVGVAYAIGD